ncbi:MAG: DJ-1/PfpI family protein [Sedimentisphaerales bacterium]|nr:DJ-1/PfpI family protein [Sedimentisphaerales bacterium]
MKRLISSLIILIAVAGVLFARQASRSAARNRPMRKIIQLAEPKLKGLVSLEEALLKRRSVRQYANRLLSFPAIGQLAWAGQGITEPVKGLRTAPSAGAIYPIDLYFATPEGLFIYHAKEHSLEQTITEDIRADLGVPPAPCDIIIAGSSRKLADRFRDKARTYMLLEAGHIAQNIQLQAVCLELGSVTIGGIDTRQVARACKLPKYTEAIYVISVGYPLAAAENADDALRRSTTSPVKGKRAAIIVPSMNFHDIELTDTKRALDMAGVETTIASTRRGGVTGMLGNTVEATVMLNALNADDYDAFVFIGGAGVVEYFDNPIVRTIARDAASKRKVLAAISAAPTILANAGVLTGRRATAFASEQQKLQHGGAVFTQVAVEKDAFIVTCSGPAAAGLFATAIMDALAGK